MSGEDRDAMLAQFQDVTGLEDAGRAMFYLESAGWNLEVAISGFFEGNEEEVPMDQGSPAVAPAPVPTPPPVLPSIQRPDLPPTFTNRIAAGSTPGGGAFPSERPEGADLPPAPVLPPYRGSQPGARGGVGANVRTVGASAAGGGRGESDSDSSEEEGQAFYAGGSSTSGQQILGPSKKKRGEEYVKDIFKKARDAGAETVDPSTSSSKSRPESHAFTGTGFKLGSTEATSEKVEGRQVPKAPRQFVLKMWRDGFSIDDGDLRPYNDPQNRAFLASVMKGAIPNELVSMAEGGEVHVDMEDHKEEEFVKPKGARKAFAGSGHVLGGIAPTVSTDSEAAEAPDPDAEKKAQDDLKVNGDAPTTSIQIRLPDGKRLIVKVNHSHTVGDLRRFVSTVRPDFVPFSLHTTYPPKELSDGAATVQSAGLIGAAVLLRRK